MGKVRVLLVDDHTVVRRGLRKILESAPEIDVVGEVGDGAAAVTAAGALLPDVVLMDVSMPGVNGIEATRQIATRAPDTKVLILSMHGDEQYVHQSLDAGAKGFLLKDVDDQDLVVAVMTVSQGRGYFSPTLQRVGSDAGGRPVDALSPKEREVLRLIGEGLSNREAAARLEVSIHTVETHRKRVMEKLDLHSTAELVRYAIRYDLAH
jgi:two-component system response regulator NreC